MIDTTLDAENISGAITEYIARCTIILDEVFFAHDSIGDFRSWLERRFQKGDPLVLLHEAPLDMVCRYLGRRPNQLSARELERATQVALSKGWVKT